MPGVAELQDRPIRIAGGNFLSDREVGLSPRSLDVVEAIALMDKVDPFDKVVFSGRRFNGYFFNRHLKRDGSASVKMAQAAIERGVDWRKIVIDEGRPSTTSYEVGMYSDHAQRLARENGRPVQITVFTSLTQTPTVVDLAKRRSTGNVAIKPAYYEYVIPGLTGDFSSNARFRERFKSQAELKWRKYEQGKDRTRKLARRLRAVELMDAVTNAVAHFYRPDPLAEK